MFNPAWRYRFFSALLLLVLAGQGWAGVTVESRFTDERDAQPGETYRGTIVLRNTDDTPSEAKVYQTDYDFSAEKGIVYGPPGQLTHSNAKWTSLSRELIEIPAHTAVSLDFEVRVPAGTGLSGTYWSVIMVDPISKSSQEGGTEAAQATARVRQTIRYAVQIVTHIGKTAAGELAFANPRLVIEGDKRFLAIDVANTGQRWLRPTLWLELYGSAGDPVGRFQGQATRLYPGTSTRARIGLADIPKGKYLGLVVADGTGDNLFGANVELEIE
jgi:hypothetical protein